MALKTKGFVNQRQLNRHFTEHGADFGASNAKEYEKFADAFFDVLPPSAHECTRKKGDKIRYDPATQALGVIDGRDVIRTYYKPVPCLTLPAALRAATARAGKCHKYANNFDYFQSECKRW